MTKRILPTPEQLRELLNYEPETGNLVWKSRRREFFPSDRSHASWNARDAGSRAFTSTDTSGYFHGQVLGIGHTLHRVAWAIHHGAWPNGEVDHIDGDRKNNKMSNLRVTNKEGNQQNAKRRKDNSSGYKGVSFHKHCEKWIARVQSSGRRFSLGYFDTPEQAHKAYCEAAIKHHGKFARTE